MSKILSLQFGIALLLILGGCILNNVALELIVKLQ